MRRLRAGDAAATAALCQRALRKFPGDANLHRLLGAAQLRQRQPALAAASLGRAIDLDPRGSAAYQGRAEALLLMGQADAAVRDLEAARRLTPDRPAILLRLGRAYAAAGNRPAALQALRMLASSHPADVPLVHELGLALCELGQFAEAEPLFAEVVAMSPQRADVWFDLGWVQQRRDRLEESIASFRRAAELVPERADYWSALGTIQTVTGEHDAATAAFRRALQQDPRHAASLAGLGHVLKTLGDSEGAVSAYRRCIEAHPDDGETYWALADLKTFRFDDGDLEAMRHRLEAGRLGSDQRIPMLFALGVACEQRQLFDQAFRCFAEANSMCRERESYDADRTHRLCERLVEVFSPAFLEQHAAAGDPDPAPIFIVGMPRSGSTLVEQVLASHRDVDGTYELPEFDQLARGAAARPGQANDYPDNLLRMSDQDFRRLGKDYIDSTQRYRNGAPRFTDKMPNNFVHIGLIALALPNATIVNVMRHPLDSCLGSYKQKFAAGQAFSYDLNDLGRYYLDYRQIMDHWHRLLPGRVLDLQYEELVQDFEPCVRRLLEHCRLPWDAGCLRFHETRRAVRSASSEQVRQPLNRQGLHRWRRYESHLDPLVDVLEPRLRELPPGWWPSRLTTQ